MLLCWLCRLVANAYLLHVTHLTTGMRIGAAAAERLNLFPVSLPKAALFLLSVHHLISTLKQTLVHRPVYGIILCWCWSGHFPAMQMIGMAMRCSSD